MPQATFAVSLDFELYWGLRDDIPLEKCQAQLANVNIVIPQLLNCFSQHQIHATWAVIGFIFFKNSQALCQHLPHTMPLYADPSINSYLHLPDTITEPALAPYYFAPHLIKQIQQCAGQEIASHSFSHYCIEEDGASLLTFKDDLAVMNHLMQQWNIQINSYVFPKRQQHMDYLALLNEQGIRAFRGNAQGFMYQSPEKNNIGYYPKKFLRFLDAFINLSGHQTFQPSVARQFNLSLINIPASRYFTPYSSSAILNKQRLKRIKSSMTHAAQRGEVFHLWWRPYDFGKNVAENFERLAEVMQHFADLKAQYGMTSRNMQEIVQAYPIPQTQKANCIPIKNVNFVL